MTDVVSDAPSQMSTEAGRAEVQAAGAVCWRIHGKLLQVLLIHRPKYNDWSWPKGKLDPGEHFPVGAVREVAEESGLTVRLGIPLPSARYRVSETTAKVVRYWAARVEDGLLAAPPIQDEVDRTEWMAVDVADKKLSRRGDRAQLLALAEAHRDGILDTWPLLILRHGHAHPRRGWGHEDALRPLVGAGRQQAADLVSLLRCWKPTRVVTSPWTRCVQSIQPFVDSTGTSVKTKGKLTEDGHRRAPATTARLVGKQLDRGRPVLICTHRPVLGTVLGSLAGHAAAGVGHLIPMRDPFLAPGEVLVAHIGHRSGRVVAVERHVAATG